MNVEKTLISGVNHLPFFNGGMVGLSVTGASAGSTVEVGVVRSGTFVRNYQAHIGANGRFKRRFTGIDLPVRDGDDRPAVKYTGTGTPSLSLDAYVGNRDLRADWSPYDLAGLNLWLTAGPEWCFQDDAGLVPCGDGDPVQLWRDRSGNGVDLSQGTFAARPVLSRADGSWGVVFDGVDDMLGGVFPSTFTDLSVETVFRHENEGTFGTNALYAFEHAEDETSTTSRFALTPQWFRTLATAHNTSVAEAAGPTAEAGVVQWYGARFLVEDGQTVISIRRSAGSTTNGTPVAVTKPAARVHYVGGFPAQEYWFLGTVREHIVTRVPAFSSHLADYIERNHEPTS